MNGQDKGKKKKGINSGTMRKERVKLIERWVVIKRGKGFEKVVKCEMRSGRVREM